MRTPQFTKLINLTDGEWSSYMKNRDLAGETITKTLMSKGDRGYRFKNRILSKIQRSPEEEELYFNLQKLLEEYSVSGKLLTNKRLYDIINLYCQFSPLTSKQQKTNRLICLSYKMVCDNISKRTKVNNKTIR